MDQIEEIFLKIKKCPICNSSIIGENISKRCSSPDYHFHINENWYGIYDKNFAVTIERYYDGSIISKIRYLSDDRYSVLMTFNRIISIKEFINGVKSGKWHKLLALL